MRLSIVLNRLLFLSPKVVVQSCSKKWREECVGAGERKGNSSSSGSSTVLWMIDLETSLFQQVVCDVICRKLEQEVRKTGRERVNSFSPHFSQEAFHGLSSPKKCSAFGFNQNP